MAVNADDIRRIALALPESAEADHFGNPSFRVAGKIFCSIGAAPAVMDFKLDLEDQANLSLAHPGVIEPVDSYWGRKGWTYVWYERADAALMEMLIRLSWANVAPKRLKPRAN
jgi:hypothetical protein